VPLPYCEFVHFASPVIRPAWTACLAALLPLSKPPFAGKTHDLAESLVHAPLGPSILALGQGNGPQEASMATRNTASRSLKSIAGAVLLALGLVILSAKLDGIADCMSSFAGISAHQAPGIFPVLGLAALHAAQTYAFDHARFLSSLLQILVSFWPLILIIIGAVLLRDAFWRRFPAHKAGAGSSAMGDR